MANELSSEGVGKTAINVLGDMNVEVERVAILEVLHVGHVAQVALVAFGFAVHRRVDMLGVDQELAADGD